jgi:hypothetical protein
MDTPRAVSGAVSRLIPGGLADAFVRGMSRKKIPPLLFLLFPLACADGQATPQSTLLEEATDLAASTGDRSDEAFYAASGLLDAFRGADLVVHGTVRSVGTQYLPGTEQRPLTVVKLEVLGALLGEKPESTLLFWTWQDSESTAAQLTEGTEITAGLLAHTGRNNSYMLAHPNALIAADGEQVFVPHLAPSHLAFSKSLKNLAGGAE